MKQDKKFHELVGFAIGSSNTLTLILVTMFFIGPTVWALFYALLWGFMVGNVYGIGKELLDKFTGKGTPEWADIWHTVKGSFIGSTAGFSLGWFIQVAYYYIAIS